MVDLNAMSDRSIARPLDGDGTVVADPGTPPTSPGVAAGRAAAGYAVHLFTALGILPVFLAMAEICSPAPDPRLVFLYLAIQVLIDALDGPMARAVDIKRSVPKIDGRSIDDLVDYLSYTFVPLMLVWRMGWVPQPAAAWVVPAMVASLFGFANKGAKDEQAGFFLGFPSYWNVVAFYAGLWHAAAGPWPGAIVIVALTILTVLPVRFIYPNLAPRPWKWPIMIGAVTWTAVLVWMALDYPRTDPRIVTASLAYPAFYVFVSVWVDTRRRKLA